MTRSRATRTVEEALQGTGLDLVASSPIADYDARAPEELRSAALMPRARGVIVVGSAGRGLWEAFRRDAEAREGQRSREEHPLDTYVAACLDRADVALGHAMIGSRRFEPTVLATPRLDFRALGEIVGLGSMGPFGMLIHEAHGPWWALRGAWLVDVEVDAPQPHRPPCVGCAAPCVVGQVAGDVALATPEVRARCVLGASSRYVEAQIKHHYPGWTGWISALET